MMMYCTMDGKEVSNLSSFYARNVLDEKWTASVQR